MLDQGTFQRLFGALAQGVVWLDPQLRIVAVNPAYLRQTGFGEAEVLGRHCYGIHHCCAYQCGDSEILAWVRDPAAPPPVSGCSRTELCGSCPLKLPGSLWKRPVPVWMRLSDETYEPMSLSFSRLTDERGAAQGFLVFFHPLDLLHDSALRTREELYRVGMELRLAAVVEKELEPCRRDAVPGLEIGAATVSYRPVGGDQVESFSRNDGGYVLLVADLSSKSLPASLMLPGLRRACHQELREGSPGEAMWRLNARLSSELPEDMFAALTVLFFPGTGRRVQVVNAGNEPPWLYRRSSGRAEELAGCIGTAFGITLDGSWPEHEVSLDPGDMLAVFTDGVSQALELSGRGLPDMLAELADSPPGSLQRSVLVLLRELERRDDTSFLALRPSVVYPQQALHTESTVLSLPIEVRGAALRRFRPAVVPAPA